MIAALHPFGGQAIVRSAEVFGACRERVAERQIGIGVCGNLVGDPDPAIEHLRRTGIGAGLGGLHDRAIGLVDFAMVAAAHQREVGGEVPHAIAREGFEHGGSLKNQSAVQPPSTTRLVPVTSAEASEARNSTAPIRSSTRPIRPSLILVST